MLARKMATDQRGNRYAAAARVKRLVAHVLGVAALVLSATSAHAQDPKPRPVPDYDGQGGRKTTPGDVAIWIPRVAAAPLYVTSEYLIRRPLGAVIMYVEKKRIPENLIDFFTFGKDHQVGFLPTAFFDFGLLPSVGLYFFWDDFLAKNNDLRLRAGTWGPKWLSFGATDRIKLTDRSVISLHAEWTRRQDWLFYGLGPLSKEENQSRYAATIFDANAALDDAITRAFHVHTAIGLRDGRFGDGSCCGDPTVTDRAALGQLTIPPGFLDGYTIVYQRLGVTLDTRAKRPAPQNGFRVDVQGQPAFNLKQSPGNAWVRYGAAAAGFVDVTGTNRVLSLGVSSLFADPIGGGTIPWNEQVVLGGTQSMRGFRPGRLVDRSAFIATLQYQWPIWVWLDGTMHVATGNVFGAGLKGIDPKLFRLSSGIGLRTSNSPDNQFELLVGFGTDTFSEGTRVSSFRLAIGATHGF
jgi:hypothetical protein